MQLTGCPNTRKVRKAVYADSGTEAVRFLRKKIAVAAANDHGAIIAYDDKDGKYRCEAMRWRTTVDAKIFESLTQVRKWWTLWQKKIGEKP